jgi:hypothetical protein
VKRFSRIVLWLLMIELVIAFAIGTRLRKEAERPATYLGSVFPSEPLDVG